MIDAHGIERDAARNGWIIGVHRDSARGKRNPLKYVRGLVRGAFEAGARIYENSEVIAIARGANARWCVRTGHGQVEAENVIHCTNACTGKLSPALSRGIYRTSIRMLRVTRAFSVARRLDIHFVM